MIEGQDRTRRWFLQRAARAALGAAGVGQVTPSLAAGLASAKAGARNPKPNRMRIDTHVHVADSRVTKALAEYVTNEGITHYTALMPDLGLIDELERNVSARCIPFHRLTEPLAQRVESFSDSPAAGYKLHLRHPMTRDRDGQPVAATEKHLGRICAEAGRLGRPILFHSDADEPEICSLRLLAELAKRYPQTRIIAAHWGMYTQEYQATKSTAEEWESKLRVLVPQNVRLLLEVNNLYADTALLGRDFPERSAHPGFKLELLIKEVEALRPAQRKALCKKLFIGTDFPNFRKAGDPNIGYVYQRDCMREIFKKDYDEDRMVRDFLRLLPKKFAT